MIAAFIVTLDTGADTDLVGISEDIKEAVEKEAFIVMEVKPYPHPTLGTPMPPTPSAGS